MDNSTPSAGVLKKLARGLPWAVRGFAEPFPRRFLGFSEVFRGPGPAMLARGFPRLSEAVPKLPRGLEEASRGSPGLDEALRRLLSGCPSPVWGYFPGLFGAFLRGLEEAPTRVLSERPCPEAAPMLHRALSEVRLRPFRVLAEAFPRPR